MGIGSVTINSSVAAIAVAPVTPVKTQSDITVKNESMISVVKSADNKQNTETTADKNQPTEHQLENVTEQLNNFMQSMNTDIHFVLHTKTNTLMIQVEDSKNHKVLKECPAHELLDMVARLRDYVGAFVDKKV